MRGFVKDPDATLDYGFDWSQWLGTDIITSSTWIVDSGLTVVPASESFDDTTTRVFISGGAVGVVYTVTNRVSTAGSRVDDRSFKITVKER